MGSEVLEKLQARLRDYDGRAITLLGEAEAELGRKAGYCDCLITLAAVQEGHVANGATWLIKSFLEAGGRLSARQAQRLCDALPDLGDWSAQLHVCQSLRFIDVPGDRAEQVSVWLTPLLQHPRPFVRAWALDALASLASSFGDYSKALGDALRAADNDEAASVRARARNLRKLM